jgi:predicted aspartyl protease
VEEDDQLPDGAPEPTILLHALTGIQSRSGRTMLLPVFINGAGLTALVDSDSTHNFIDTDAAAQVGVTLHARPSIHVAVANGDHLTSPGCCQALDIAIGGETLAH